MSQIKLKVEDLPSKEKVEFKTIGLEDIFTLLQCTPEGLITEESQRRLELFRPNKLESEEQNPFLQFLGFMWSPLSWVMEGAALVAIALLNGGGRPPDWEDFVGIILLLLLNSSIGFYKKHNAVKALMDSLAPKAKVRCNGSWLEIESADLVPGDMVSFKIGDVVPANCRLTEAINVSIYQAALTGESLSQSKKNGDQCFSGSTCKQGEAEGVVISTGANTFFGRAASLVGRDDDTTGHLQKILAQIGSFCLVSIGIFVVLEILALYADRKCYMCDYRRLDGLLVLLISGIPITMPIVLSVTLAVGAPQLAKHKAIVTRITALEELAGVTILCSDKTAMLTTNKLTIDKATVKTYGPFSPENVILLSDYTSRTENQDVIDACVIASLGDPTRARKGIKLLDFKPFNPIDKRKEITDREESSSKIKHVLKGMTTAIINLCTWNKTDEVENQLETDVVEFATRGLRALAVAYEELDHDDHEAEGNGLELVGLLAIYNLPCDDPKQTISDVCKVKMVTGFQSAVAKETGHRLGLGDQLSYHFPVYAQSFHLRMCCNNSYCRLFCHLCLCLPL